MINANIYKSMQIPLIYGGKDAHAGQFPYIVAICEIQYNKFSQRCGGSILNSKWILTAKHCLVDFLVSDLLIIAGSINWKYGTRYFPDKSITHRRSDADIGLIKIKSEIRFNEFVKPINIGREFVGPNQDVIVAGWGKTEYGRTAKLQFLKTRTITNRECINKMPRVLKSRVTPNLICALIPSKHETCHGDSGGPLVSNNKLIGIVSFGSPNCGKGFPEGYVRVSQFYGWITNIINKQ